MTCFRVRSIELCFSVGDRSLLGFGIRAANHLVLVRVQFGFCGWSKVTWVQRGGWNFTWMQCRDEIDLVFVWVVEIDSISVQGSELNLFLLCCRKWLVFSVWIEINSVFFVSGHRNRLDIRVGIEIGLFSVMQSTLTWFLCAGSKLTWFQCGDRKWLFFCGGQNWLRSCVQAEISWFWCFFYVWIEIELMFVCVPKLPRF